MPKLRPPRSEQMDVPDDIVTVAAEPNEADAAAERVRAASEAAAAVAHANQQRQLHEQAIKQRQEQTVVENHILTIDSAMQNAEAEAEQAVQDMANAKARGDYLGEAKAQRNLVAAEQRIMTLANGRDELTEQQQYTPPVQQQPPPQQPPTVEGLLSQMPNLTNDEREWIRRHPDSVLDPGSQQIMRATYIETERRGIPRGSPEYFRLFESRLGYRQDEPTARHQQAAEDDYPEEAPQQRYAAPVSRSSGGSTNLRPGQIMLSEDQRQIARASGITEVEYARQLQKLRALKSQGLYQ